MSFAALPPEINSGRMYAGPGSGPMLAAAAAWSGLAAELSSTASSYDAVISGLTGEAWSGPTAASMTAAVTPYVRWMSVTATQAEQTASQARTAAAAYDAAYAATVPPPVVAANRSLLMSLIATNILGQNTAAIAAAEALYAEMWAQDAGAMYGYAAACAGATRFSPVTAPPPTTTPGGLGHQLAAVSHAAAATGVQAQTSLSQLINMVPPALQSLSSSVAPATQATGGIFDILNYFAGPLSPISLFGIGGIPYLLAIQCVMLPMNASNVIAAVAKASAAGVLTPEGVLLAGESVPLTDELGEGVLVSSSGPTVSAGVGNASPVGRLSAPAGWNAAASTAKTVAAVTPNAAAQTASLVAAEGQSGMLSDLALGGMAGRAIGATGGAAASRAAGEPAVKAAVDKPSAATIIVIPPSAAD